MAIVYMVLGVLCFAIILSTVGDTIQSMGLGRDVREELRAKRMSVYSWFRQHGLRFDLRDRVRGYFDQVYVRLVSWPQVDAGLGAFPCGGFMDCSL